MLSKEQVVAAAFLALICPPGVLIIGGLSHWLHEALETRDNAELEADADTLETLAVGVQAFHQMQGPEQKRHNGCSA